MNVFCAGRQYLFYFEVCRPLWEDRVTKKDRHSQLSLMMSKSQLYPHIQIPKAVASQRVRNKEVG